MYVTGDEVKAVTEGISQGKQCEMRVWDHGE